MSTLPELIDVTLSNHLLVAGPRTINVVVCSHPIITVIWFSAKILYLHSVAVAILAALCGNNTAV